MKFLFILFSVLLGYGITTPCIAKKSKPKMSQVISKPAPDLLGTKSVEYALDVLKEKHVPGEKGLSLSIKTRSDNPTDKDRAGVPTVGQMYGKKFEDMRYGRVPEGNIRDLYSLPTAEMRYKF